MIEKIVENKKIKAIVIVVLSLLAAVSLVQGIRNAVRDSQDFQWDAMKVFSLKINPYDESASMNPSGILEEYGFDEYYLQMEANQFPSLLMLLLPFVGLKPLAARYVWIVCNLIFTALIVLLLRKTFLKDIDKYGFYALSLLMIAGTPYRNQIGVGQHTLFAFCFFLAAVYFSEYAENRNEILTVFSLFVCYFKYTLTVPLVLYFVYKKRYKEIIVSAFAHVVLTFVSGWWLNDSFINMIIKPLKVSSNLAAEGGLDISALLGGASLAYVLALVIMIWLFITAIKLEDGYDCSYMAVLILWSLIITYHRTYDFFVMIAVSALFVEMRKKENSIVDGEKIKVLNIYYIITMLAVFFVLRVFHESTGSKIAVGAMYYLLTAIATYIVSRGMLWKRKMD